MNIHYEMRRWSILFQQLELFYACELREFSQFDSMEFALNFFLWKTDNDNVNNLSISENGMCGERTSCVLWNTNEMQ